MKNYSSSSTNKLLIKYVVKSLLSTIIFILAFSYLFAKITYTLDLDLSYNLIFSFFVVFLTSSLTAFISVLSLKNNGALMGMISSLPLIFYCIADMIINENSFIMLLIKIIISLASGALFGIFATKRTNKFKVK